MSADKWLDAGDVEPSLKRYRVTFQHGHKHLVSGDVVVMTVSPSQQHLLLRLSDMTLHHIEGQSGQYVHLEETQ